MKKFLFVIPSTPNDKLSDFRRELCALSRKSLLLQKSTDWEAVVLGEQEGKDGPLTFLNMGTATKEQKLHQFAGWLMTQPEQRQFVIRFDDDDLINPDALQQLGDANFDCYADREHWFYDVSSGLVSAQRRMWLANTVIHKTSHALTTWGEYHKGVADPNRKAVLLQNDHSQTWHRYYSDKKVRWSPFSSPLYVRLLSPGSITAEATDEYQKYLSGFGYWKDELPPAFRPYAGELKAIWLRHFGPLKTYNFSSKGYLKSRLLRMLGK